MMVQPASQTHTDPNTVSGASISTAVAPMELGDFTANHRMVLISLIAVVIGVISTYVALALLKLIALFTHLFYYAELSFAPISPSDNHLGLFAVAVPVVGALIIGLMARFGSERIRGHGIPEALEAILVGGSRVDARVALLKPLSSAISIGSGGPFGAEGPIIMTGGAVGSLVAQLFHLTAAERKTLLVAGAAAGMSATFASPLAAMMLAVELLLFEWKPRSFVPVALASATAAAARNLVIGAGPLFPMSAHAAFAGFGALGCCVVAGVAAGCLSAALTYAVYAAEDLFKHLPIHWMWWPMLGGLAIGLGGLVCPRALGVGYDTIGEILHEGIATRALLVLVLVKATIWAVSLGSGTSGGVLAPLLMMGGALGGLLGMVFPRAGLGFWPIVCMGAILGGTMRSPFTGILFAVELTHDMNMILPLAVAVSSAHAFTVLTLRRSILTEKVARRGFHVSREYAIDDLVVLFVRDVVSTEVIALPADRTLREAAEMLDVPVDDKGQHVYPVLDDAANLVASVTSAELSAWTRDDANLSRTMVELARTNPAAVFSNETLLAATQQMAVAGVTRLLVLNPADSRRVVGVLALHDILKARALQVESERRRERILPAEYLIPAWLRRVPGRLASRVAPRR